MPEIRDQGDLSSCTSFSIGTMLNFIRMKQREKPEFVPSALFIYYNERLYENSVNEDGGAYIRTGIKVVNKIGFAPDNLWPYDVKAWKKKPPKAAYDAATQYKSVSYYRLNGQDISELKTCLASGYPFVFGFSVFNSIETADKTGVIPMPGKDDEQDGGHAICCCGYDDAKKLFLLHNSWGVDVGDQGYYYLPYEYMTNPGMSDDFWTIRQTKETDGV
jgi:C1A family cysteine protease